MEGAWLWTKDGVLLYTLLKKIKGSNTKNLEKPLVDAKQVRTYMITYSNHSNQEKGYYLIM